MMQNLKNVNALDFSHINGWGIDADPDNDPTYPIKHWTGDDHERSNWERPPLQIPNEEILHSNERPTLSAVFGASHPPKGLSGRIRRYAFKFSESDYGHWLPLLLADRIDVLEGIVEDVSTGHFPKILAEKGWKSELKYNPKGAAKTIAVHIVIGLILYQVFFRKKSRTRV